MYDFNVECDMDHHFCLFLVLMQTAGSQHQLLTEKQVKHSLQVVGVPPDGMKVLDQKLINVIGRTNAMVGISFESSINNLHIMFFSCPRT